MTRSINLTSHVTGPAADSASTSSKGIAISEMSWRRLFQQDLDREHREEWQDQRRPGHAEHVAEIRNRAHQHLFGYILNRAAAAHHRVVHNGRQGNSIDGGYVGVRFQMRSAVTV
jgi:hypothetical protein